MREVDHVVELRHGGTHAYDNMQGLCCSCHKKKTKANTWKNVVF